jgi:O-6-methylguanine DNA methyltransferase
MSDQPADSTAAAEEPPVEPTRILIPSTLGGLGIELTGELITRVVIVPKGKERKQFRPFADLKRSERSEFLDEVLGRFSEYLAGARRNLELEYDLKATGLPNFAREGAGRPDAYRQVLSVLMANPMPLVIPCHRVVTTKSGAGSFIGGQRKKLWLLKLEQKTLAMN